MTEAHATAPQSCKQAGARQIKPDAAQHARERRYQRALAGWIASRMRAGAHRRRADR